MIALLLLALALSMDAFAVSLCHGCSTRSGMKGAARMALAFGAAQAIMPLIGWALGTLFVRWMEAVDHWVAFVLLVGLGLKMGYEGLQPAEEATGEPLAGHALLAAALATSIDAAAAGITLPTLGVHPGIAVAVIGAVTAILCFAGALGGARLGAAFGKKAEIAGGLVLIGLGVRILGEHQGWIH